MRHVRLLLPIAASCSLTCAGPNSAPRDPSATDAEIELVPRPAPARADRLVFPPEPTEPRHARRSAPADVDRRADDRGFRVVEPDLGADGAFDATGQRFRIVFSEPIKLRDASPQTEAPGAKRHKARGPIPADPGAVRISPSLPGRARWLDAYTLEFVAAQRLRPGARYTIELGALEALSGDRLETWKATAVARASVAGKLLDYVPQIGQPRVVALEHSDGATIGPQAALGVLFDQPITLSLARALVTLEDADGHPVPFRIDRPNRPTFRGVPIDPRFVAVVAAAKPVRRGTLLVLSARDRFPREDAAPERVSLAVAPPLALGEVICSGYRPLCAIDGSHVKTDARELELRFESPLARMPAIRNQVSIRPAVRNLVVGQHRWDPAVLTISGGFEPSTKYELVLSGIHDAFGGGLAAPVHLEIETAPVGASAAMPEGEIVLDQATSRTFAVTTRNVEEAEIALWPVAGGDAAALSAAGARARSGDVPSDDPAQRVRVAPKLARDELVTTKIDLAAALTPDRTYLAALRPTKLAFGAEMARASPGDERPRTPVALLVPGSAKTLAVHARTIDDATLVQVARLSGGEPVAGAAVELLDADPPVSATTDANGVALLRGVNAGVLRVRAADAELPLALGTGRQAKDLFPELAHGVDIGAADRRALVLTDRGIYRPGSKLFVSAIVRRPEGDRLVSVPETPVRLRLVGPTGEEVAKREGATSDRGALPAELALPGDAKLGRHQLLLEDPASGRTLARSVVQVAEFETPRFAVDVETALARGAAKSAGDSWVASAAPVLRASVKGRYVFGAAMSGAEVHWTVKRRPAALPSGPLTDAGLVFRDDRDAWWDDEATARETWTRAGDAVLGADGKLALDVPLSMKDADGPQHFTLEAEVTDRSHRAIAGRGALTIHPAARYPGLHVERRWVRVGETLPVDLGVAAPDGKPIAGATVTAHLSRIDWRYAKRLGPGGSLKPEWSREIHEVSRCSVQSGNRPVACSIKVPTEGDFALTAEVDGRAAGSTTIWAWRDGEPPKAHAAPSRGRTIDVVPDKNRYAPGDTAKLFVRSPFAAATAVLTIEQGELLEKRAQRIDGSSAVLEVPIQATYAPYAHATVTLLPIGPKDRAMTDARIGAVRLAVADDAARVDVGLKTDRPTYAPGEEAEVAIDVSDHGKPTANADVTLAVVDDGVLRLTGFHAVDPVAALRPGRALAFTVRDSRDGLAALAERSHVGGDGDGGEMALLTTTRKRFVETALWRPDLRTDANGHTTAKFKLPDNLTQFRVMAVAIDPAGKGGSAESAFTVSKPVVAIPAVPRFASVGDRFEAAAMIHNNTVAARSLTVTLGEQQKTVTVAAAGHERVGFPVQADAPGTMALAFGVAEPGGAPLDRVEARIPVEPLGIEEHPRLNGSFAHAQTISLELPASVEARDGDAISIRVGEHLWPELGARLEYLLNYPHGCVEQTTSSTLPLIAARDIMPRIGLVSHSEDELRTKIVAGLERLRSMRTTTGGLGYWPGDEQPNPYGTAYAMRAVVLAKRGGIEPPSGLLEGMTSYLGGELLAASLPLEVRSAIAQSLAELGELPASATDALYATRDQQSVFGAASLALALATLPAQRDRVEALLDDVERRFEADGTLLDPPRSDDFSYYGSPRRTKAQAAIALATLRRRSKLLPILLGQLANETEPYTTQATAYSLLAVAQNLRAKVDGGADVRVFLDGAPIAAAHDLGFGSKEFRVPVALVRGKTASLRLEAAGDDAIGFLVSAALRRPYDAPSSPAATTAAHGPDVHRVYTDASGAPVDLARVHTGDVLRVALVARMPQIGSDRRGFLALSDRLPAGFEPIQPDLATVASAPEIGDGHPYAWLLRYGSSQASHVELHDDRVNVYFDRVFGDLVAASYLVRATTPGEFVVPPPSAELMYEPDGDGYGDAAKVTIR